jgi:FkbM family methyltransferase
MKLLIPTRRKLQIGRLISLALQAGRRLAGLPVQVAVVRDGIRWSLDLTEGIDLALYLGAYQKLGAYVENAVLRPGTVALDIGANVGAFTLPLAARLGEGGRVIAIEPTFYAFEKLRANLALNPMLSDRVITFQALLGTADKVDYKESVFSSWQLSGRSDQDRHPAHGGRLMSVAGSLHSSLDLLLVNDARLACLADQISFVKLDVDGHELDVIRGAQHLLERRRPALLVEIAPYVQNERPGGTQLLLFEIAQRGYTFCDPDTGVPFPQDLERLERLIPDGAGTDVLCLPR